MRRPRELDRVALRSVFFFFQAEDGIRDSSVTGVQTCALPICQLVRTNPRFEPGIAGGSFELLAIEPREQIEPLAFAFRRDEAGGARREEVGRSEERRVGKEWRSRWWPYH